MDFQLSAFGGVGVGVGIGVEVEVKADGCAQAGRAPEQQKISKRGLFEVEAFRLCPCVCGSADLCVCVSAMSVCLCVCCVRICGLRLCECVRERQRGIEKNITSHTEKLSKNLPASPPPPPSSFEGSCSVLLSSGTRCQRKKKKRTRTRTRTNGVE